MGLEREVKLRIADASGYERLAHSLSASEARLQRNTYFDTPDLALAKAGTLVRVREEGGRVVLAVKRGLSRAPGRIESEEWEKEIEPDLWRTVRSGRATLTAAARFDPLDDAAGGRAISPIGSLENLRRTAHGPARVVYELDETRFPWGERQYELEIESDDPEGALALARELLDRLGVAFDDRAETKHERLFLGLASRGGPATSFPREPSP